MEHHVIDYPEAFDAMKDYLDNSTFEYLVIDTETDNKIENLANLVGFGLCVDDEQGFYIPFRNKDKTKFWPDQQENQIVDYLINLCRKKKLIGHNIIYDILVLYYNWNVDLTEHIYSDTILQKHSINEERPFGLKEVAVQYLGPWADKAQKALYDNIKANGGKTTKDQMDMWCADTNILGEYCVWDVLLTMKLFNLFEQKIKEEGLFDLFYKDEIMPLYKEVTIPMKKHGFPINVDYFKQLETDISEEISTLESKIQSLIQSDVQEFIFNTLENDYPVKVSGSFPKVCAEVINFELPKNKNGVVTLAKKAVNNIPEPSSDTHKTFLAWLKGDGILPEELIHRTRLYWYNQNNNSPYIFNLKSNDHLKWLFFDKYGEEPLSKTDGGDPQVDEDFLDSMGEKYAWVKFLIDYKKLLKLKSTYIEGILERQIDGIIYSSYIQFGPPSGRYASRDPNCFSMDTEVLTDSGFKFYRDLSDKDLVASFDTQSEVITFTKPNQIWKSESKVHNIVECYNEHIKIKVTDNHRCLFKNRKTGKYKTVPASEFINDHKFLHGAYGIGGEDFIFGKKTDNDFLRYLVACQADAEITNYNKIRFVFHKERKYLRLKEILSNLKLNYVDKSKPERYEVLITEGVAEVLNEIGKEKTFPSHWIKLHESKRRLIIEELFYWDGSFTRKQNYSSNNEKNIDLIQALAALSGYRAHKRIYITKAGNNNYQLDFSFRNYSLTTNCKIKKYQEKCEVWCLSVDSGYVVGRRGSDTFIMGNCQNLPRVKEEDSGLSELVLKYSNSIKKGFIAPKGKVIVNSDFSQLEPRAFAEACGDYLLQQVFHNNEDLYGSIACRVFSLDCTANEVKKKYPEQRQKAKVIALATVYGAEAGRISQLLNIGYMEAQKIINDYLNSYPGLKKYMSDCNREACSKGFVKTKFGRTRHLNQAKVWYERYGTRLLDKKWAKQNGLEDISWQFKSMLNLAKNFKIQGVAAHVVNRAAIEISREFKKNNINGQIVAQVHDELTCIVQEDKAELAKEIVKNCMEQTTKLSVPLKAEPLIAKNWSEAK